MSSISDLLTKKYTNFKGVDFTGGIVPYYRSPDALNMWKDYREDDCIQTRPGLTLLNEFTAAIYGLFFFRVNENVQVLVHVGTKLLKWNNYPETPVVTSEIYTGLKQNQSRSFIFENTFFFMDGEHYLEYDGTTMKEVVGTIPITSYYRNPDGSTSIDESTDIDLVYQPVNLLSNLRKNLFIADGKSTNFHLDTVDLDSADIYSIKVVVDNQEKEETTDFTVDREKGIIKFKTIPEKEKEISITFSKTTNGYKERILNSNLLCEFDNRIFFSGNKDYPNTVFHCELNDPRYVRDTAYYECGLDDALIKTIIPGNDKLWVIKEINQNNSSVYYMTPTVDNTYGKIYPSVNGSLSLGCVSTGINFNDDILYFSKRGLESISDMMYSSQSLSHRSSNIDSKMLNDLNYENVKVTIYRGYLMCLINSHIYLADSRAMFQNQSGKIEYEWFYWELPFNITYIKEYRGNLYLGNNSGQLFKLDGITDNGTNINSYWTTKKEDFDYPSYTKTTNKRGNTADLKKMNNDNIHVDTIVDGVLKEKNIFNDTKGYIAYRIKDKKFKQIQIKFSSNKPFGLFSCTLQGFIAGYIKR